MKLVVNNSEEIKADKTNIVSLADARKKHNLYTGIQTKTVDERCLRLEEIAEELIKQNVDLSREIESVRGHLMTLLRCLKQERDSKLLQDSRQKKPASHPEVP